MRTRRVVTATLVLAFEIWLYTEYAALGAQFHFWLHTLFGAALGLVALTLLRLVRRRQDGRTAPWEAGWLGQFYSIFPDILFLTFGVLHMMWMDVFALHISLHFVPRPLLAMWVLFTLSLVGYGLSRAGYRLSATVTLGVFAAVGAFAIALAPDMPVRLDEVRGHGGLALMCPVLLHPAQHGPA